ncbi:DUF554 domain-containing protein [Clostridium sp. Marseille-P299]|uniref:DUF554 domain-containing protein n=1 Tax=Clostridium sp. Marseille-P299 TaxID=1805477 RepID=UPI000835A4B5|nr:DUF554 domain-containing protein [Clostridium sp. Marseille-P299]
MLYILWNMIGIEIAGFVSSYAKKIISKAQLQAVLIIANLCIAAVGIQGAITTKNNILMIISCVLGAMIGVKMDLDGKFNQLGLFIKSLFKTADENFVKGFITVFMMQCVGSMAIVGPLNIGLKNDSTILSIKIILDICSTLIYGAIYGRSVMLSGPFVFLYETVIFLLAGILQPILTSDVINEISAIGSLLIFGMSLDLLGVIKLKVANYLPALLGPIVYYMITT